MEKVLIINGEKCTGCRVCELVCSSTKSGEYNPEKSRIKIMRNTELDVNIPVISPKCDACGKCTEWCFTKAIRFVSPKEATILRKKTKIGEFPAPIVS